MNLVRCAFCLAMFLWAGSFCGPMLRADDIGSKLEHAVEEVKDAASHDPDEATDGADPLSVDPDLAVWTLIVFVVLMVVLKKFAWGPIVNSLETREKSIADHITQAERNHQEAKRLLAQYEQKLALAAGEVREMMEAARREAEHAKQAILAEAKAGAETERNRSLQDIETATDQAMEALARKAAQLAVDLAGKILQARLSGDDHTRLIEEAVKKFPASSPSSN